MDPLISLTAKLWSPAPAQDPPTKTSRSPSEQPHARPDLIKGRSEGDLRSRASSTILSDSAYTRLRPDLALPESTLSQKLAALASPCFFHRRFDDAVDIEKVLAEIAADETMSHSKLMQTATGVREVSKQLQKRPIRRAVRNVMIITKARDNSLVHLTRAMAEWLLRTPRYGSSLGVNVYVDYKLRKSKRFNAPALLSQDARFDTMLRYWTPDLCWESPEKFDLVITLGGDGTVLFTSWLFQRIVPPILSFSLGSLGFLTPFEFDSFPEQLDRVMGGLSSGRGTPTQPTAPLTDTVADAGMLVNLRMRFTCTVYRNLQSKTHPDAVEESSQFEVLNELVIDRGPSPYVSNLELFGDDQLLTVIQADGVIFSTPTGSTAYSLSAGGSLVHPDIPAILLTPICPHTLSFRPMLLNDTLALRVAVPRASRATAYCSFDGKGRIELRQGDFVTISASKYPFPTVQGGRMEWIDSVSRTLRWNTREAQQKGWAQGAEARSGAAVKPARAPSAGWAMVADDVDDEDADDAEFDIDIDDEEPDSRDSGYDAGSMGGSSSVQGRGSPMRRGSRMMDALAS